MPIHKISGLTVNVCGDVHLGRTFRTGVPLHRLGDREEMVWEEFEQQLNVEADITVIMGDLFDKFVVPPEVVLRAYDLLTTAADNGREIIILRGNHDASRDSNKKSSFDLLRELTWPVEGILVAERAGYHQTGSTVFLFCGWSPDVSAHDDVSFLQENKWGEPVAAAFGHWDITQHGEDTHNLIPLDALANLGVGKVFTGHIHKAEAFTRNGMEIHVVGSMQPYAHGEEPDGSMLYMTLTPEQVEDMLEGDEDIFADSNVRILLIDGAEYPREFNCLSRTFKRTLSGVAKVDEEGNPVAAYDTFDLRTMISTTLTEFGVSEALQSRINTTLTEKLSHA